MGSLTDSTKKIIHWLFGSEKVVKKQSKVPDHLLQEYLDVVYPDVRSKIGLDLNVPKTSFSISIFMRSKGATHPYAGKFDIDELYFSGSLVKVAAMFAAHSLRANARALIKDMVADPSQAAGITSSATFFTRLEQRLNLAGAVPEITNASGIAKKPSYDSILKITGDFNHPETLAVDFTNTPDGFLPHMRKMIIPSDNCSAGVCIRRLSYPYINVELMKAGFFSKDTMKGVWLCGDYIADFCPQAVKDLKQTYIRLPTINDCKKGASPPQCGSAQDATSKPMALFFLKILTGELVDATSSGEMLGLLVEAQAGNDFSFLSKSAGANDSNRATGNVAKKFTITGIKIGQGEIKTDPDRNEGGIAPEVRSEGEILKWKIAADDTVLRKKFDDLNLTGEFAVCWQNLSNLTPNTDGIIELLNRTIEGYINQSPPLNA